MIFNFCLKILSFANLKITFHRISNYAFKAAAAPAVTDAAAVCGSGSGNGDGGVGIQDTSPDIPNIPTDVSSSSSETSSCDEGP